MEHELSAERYIYALNQLRNEYFLQKDMCERLIVALKPFAFAFQQARTNDVRFEDCLRAHLLLIDIIGKEDYLQEATNGN